MSTVNRTLSGGYLSLVYLLLYLPIVVLVVFSFNNSLYSGLWHGATLKWYRELFHDSNLLTIALHSLTISVLASSIATLIGLFAAIALYKYRFMGRQLINGVLFVMIIIPDLVMGVALLLLFHAGKVPLGFWTLLLAHITFCIPFVMVTVSGRLVGSDNNLFAAAKDLGATDWGVVHRVMVPMLKPAIIAAWLLSFTLSFDDVVISTFVSGPTYQILPLYIFSSVKLGVTPELNALCSFILLLTIGLAVSAQLLLRRR